MAKNKYRNKNVAAETSESDKKPTFEKLKALNAKLLKEVEEHRQEIEQLRQETEKLRHQLAAATEKADEAETRLLAAVKETDEKTAELAKLEEKVGLLVHAKEIPEPERCRKWLFSAASFLVGTTIGILACRSTSTRN